LARLPPSTARPRTHEPYPERRRAGGDKATPSAVAASRLFRWAKAALFILLTCNAAIFSFHGSLTEALDATAWLTLLALFELETGHGHWLGETRAGTAVHAIRLAATAAIGAAAVGYLYEEQWLDAANTWLWIAVVALLEFEVRYPQAAARRRSAITALTALLYSALTALVPVWAWRGEWFDAYDAGLWLIAFATIEINMLRITSGESALELGDKA
jgi:hypothetical protein